MQAGTFGPILGAIRMYIPHNLLKRLRRLALNRPRLATALLPTIVLSCPPVFALELLPELGRYSPGHDVVLSLNGAPAEETVALNLKIWRGADRVYSWRGSPENASEALRWNPPVKDYQGYLIVLSAMNSEGEVIDVARTAVDVSSDWKHFPRYGYLSYYSRQDGVDPEAWITALNRYHLNGLEYYDFQYKHHLPLAGTVKEPATEWLDIAGRHVESSTLHSLIDAAHRRNMVNMAYNASYSAYADALGDGSGVQLKWGIWDNPDQPRTAESIMGYRMPDGWQTPRLLFMDQDNPEWRAYIFKKTRELFAVYPFDGWHIDTFGIEGGYNYAGKPVNFAGGLAEFADSAATTLQIPLLINTVNTEGQDEVARSKVEFVYSELWTGHETFRSILETADAARAANPDKAIVFPAYIHRGHPAATDAGPLYFNTPTVLLTDAVIFASGAAHVELGDDLRLLCSEYFPNRQFVVSETLKEKLLHYYNFLTAYENELRDRRTTVAVNLALSGHTVSSDASGGSIWAFGRQDTNSLVVHLINLLGTNRVDWRDINADRPDAPSLNALTLSLSVPRQPSFIWWASPDYKGGEPQQIQWVLEGEGSDQRIHLTLPNLKYWDMLVIQFSHPDN